MVSFAEDVTRELGRVKSNILFANQINVENAVVGAANANVKVKKMAALDLKLNLT